MRHPANVLIDKLRARAEHCRENAERSSNPADQAQWLIFADQWLRFVEQEHGKSNVGAFIVPYNSRMAGFQQSGATTNEAAK
jgi:hypothetical protein